jgi:transcriptional regulator with XRE-family HTH domain
MELGLTNTELVKAVRGDRTQQQFAELLGLARCMISDYERGAVIPSSQTWRKLGDSAGYPLNVYCWQRGGLSREVISKLMDAMRSANEAANAFSLKPNLPEAVERMRQEIPAPEPVTELPADE